MTLTVAAQRASVCAASYTVCLSRCMASGLQLDGLLWRVLTRFRPTHEFVGLTYDSNHVLGTVLRRIAS